MLRMLRNNLAHGKFHLMPGSSGSYGALQTCGRTKRPLIWRVHARGPLPVGETGVSKGKDKGGEGQGPLESF